jgi:hypothetical protein
MAFWMRRQDEARLWLFFFGAEAKSNKTIDFTRAGEIRPAGRPSSKSPFKSACSGSNYNPNAVHSTLDFIDAEERRLFAAIYIPAAIFLSHRRMFCAGGARKEIAH